MTDLWPRARRWNRFLPKGLFGRALLILIIPIIVLQFVVTFVFIERHLDGVTRQMSATIARELRSFASVVENQPNTAAIRRTTTELSAGIGYDLTFIEGDFIDPQVRRPFYRITARAMVETLRRDVGYPISVNTEMKPKHVTVRIQVSNGILVATVPTNRLTTRNPHFLLVWMMSVSVFLLVIAVLFLRNQVRPIRQLVSAAEAFGKGQPAPDFKASGAEEVRRAAQAFITMRARIERQIAQRTMMLSGVSHDLRTPLTRMRLALAMLDDAEEAAMLNRDVDEMERMVDGFLAFARDQQSEKAEAVDLAAMLADVVGEQRAHGHPVHYTAPDAPEEVTTLGLRPDAMRRCLRNLMENAVKYGSGQVWVSLGIEPRRLTVSVDDNGPGIPADQRDDVVRPFTRGDAARNQDKGGGTGLGLSIVLDVARAHGGDLILSDSAHGGLQATVYLPK